MASYGSWTGPARAMAQAIDAAVTAAQAADADGFDEALTALYRVDNEQLLVLLGAVTRDLLERAHPDGLDADDAEQMLTSCVRAAGPWYPEVDPELVIRAMSGALGIHAEDDAPAAKPTAVLAHGLLLIADQLTVAGERLAPLLDGALRELHRSQTVELP
jgi:hypothetical protein